MKIFLNELKFYLFQLKQNFRNQQALRMSFFLQIVAMILSNSSFFVIWMMFSHTIGTVNGWGTIQTFGMMSVSMLVFGIVHSCFGSTGGMHDLVPTGQFDTFLTRPKSLYVRIINHQFAVSALGDLIQGVVGLAIFLCFTRPSWQQTGMILAMLPPAVLVHIAFALTCDCIIFWMPHAGSLSRALFDLILLPTTQPISLLRGVMRFVYLFAIPALLIAGLPIEAFTHVSWKLFWLSYAISFGWFLLSFYILKISVRRYESGNAIG